MSDPTTETQQRWLGPGLAGIGTASFLADVGHEIPTALLPNLLTVTLGAPAATLGLIEGGHRRLAGRGAASWRLGRPRVARPGPQRLVGRHRAGRRLRAGVWVERACDNLGAIAGPLLALALVGLVGVRTAIALSVIPGLLAALAIVYAIRHAPRAEQRERQPLRLRVRPVLAGRLGRLMVAVSAFEFGNVAATLLILRASDLLSPAGTRIGRPSRPRPVRRLQRRRDRGQRPGRLGDRRGAVLVLVLGVGLFGLAYAGFAAGPTSVPALAPWFVAAGVAIGCVETAEHAAVAALAPVELRGSAFGLLAAVQSFGNLAASAIAGLLWTLASPRVAFAYLVAWMGLALVGLLLAERRPLSTSGEANVAAIRRLWLRRGWWVRPYPGDHRVAAGPQGRP